MLTAEQSYIGQYFEHVLKTADESYIFLTLVIIGLMMIASVVSIQYYLSREDRKEFDKKLEKKETEWKAKFLEREKYWSDKNEVKNEELRQCSIEHYKIINQFTWALKKDGEVIQNLSEKIEKLNEELEKQWNL